MRKGKKKYGLHPEIVKLLAIKRVAPNWGEAKFTDRAFLFRVVGHRVVFYTKRRRDPMQGDDIMLARRPSMHREALVLAAWNGGKYENVEATA